MHGQRNDGTSHANFRNLSVCQEPAYDFDGGLFMFEHWLALRKAEWQPVPRWALVAWGTFYAVFLAYVFHSHGGFLFVDLANLVVHEGGHMLFGWFGDTLALWGGTLLQWMVPFLLAGYFFTHRQAA